MRPFLIPILAIASLIVARALTPQTPQQPQDVPYFWLAVYTYELPKGLQTEGQHTYQYNFSYTSPKPGSLVGAVHKVEVSSQAQLYQKSVLLRPGGVQALGLSSSCMVIKKINPQQPVKFMVAWVPDVHYTQAQFIDQLNSMKATVRWDNQPPVDLVFQQGTISWSPLYECQPWVNSTSGGQQIGMLLP